ncbi:unnamed protein product [Aspergillus oryzae var. brunneus]|uniref:Unnamed protein product n=1 Tax=Aspergillus oryzae var. brunneus TaxID=332754 RepID=A0ABQ6KM89_ASPOZ|nr:unnamed protein product [Aspergillus oryzae var. brunneus]
MSNNNNNNQNNHHQTSEVPRRLSRSSRAGMPGPERRRSAAGANFNLNNNEPTGDSMAPSDHRSSLGPHGLRTSSPSSLGGSPIIATGDPHHQRAPSLGELHQELEQEQEAQVDQVNQRTKERQVSELSTSPTRGGVRSGEIAATPATEGGATADPHATVGVRSTNEPADKT